MEAVQYWVPGDNPDTAGVATTPSTLANFVPPLKGSLQCQPGEGQRCTGAFSHGHITMVYAEIVGSGPYNVTGSHCYGQIPQNTVSYARLVCPWPFIVINLMILSQRCIWNRRISHVYAISGS